LERKVGKYTVKGTGHHVIPVELWEEFGFDPDTYAMLDSYRMINAKTHNYLGHGNKTGYSGFLRAELRERLADYLKCSPNGTLSLLEQQSFIKKFIDDVHEGKVKRRFIKDFNDAAEGGTNSVRKWIDNSRGNYPAEADDVAEVAIKGLRSIDSKLATKLLGYLTGSAKIAVRYAPFVSAILVYNEQRVNGKCPAEAATIAGLEEINPLPIGFSEFEAAGKKYEEAIEWALENNVHGGRAGRIPRDKQGFPKSLFPD
jgi:hypothetical protein